MVGLRCYGIAAQVLVLGNEIVTDGRCSGALGQRSFF
jgi:hypothetical protein